MLDAELLNKFSIWRQKSNAGTLTIEEQREAVAALRSKRRGAAEASKASKSRKGPVRNADDLLGELDGLS